METNHHNPTDDQPAKTLTVYLNQSLFDHRTGYCRFKARLIANFKTFKRDQWSYLCSSWNQSTPTRVLIQCQNNPWQNICHRYTAQLNEWWKLLSTRSLIKPISSYQLKPSSNCGKVTAKFVKLAKVDTRHLECSYELVIDTDFRWPGTIVD